MKIVFPILICFLHSPTPLANAHSVSNTSVHLEHDSHVSYSNMRVDVSYSPISNIVSPSSDSSSLSFTIISDSSLGSYINVHPMQTRSKIALS